MIFRAWEEKDLGALLALEEACFSCPWTEEMLHSSFRSPRFLGILAESEGEIVGYIGGETLFEVAETHVIAVRDAFRKQGIATELLTRFEKEALRRGATNAFLEVRVSNVAARALYEKFSYRQIALRKRYYPDGEDAFVMSKNI